MKDKSRKTAWLYDYDQNDLCDDIPFYQEYALLQRGAVLELGCGTGRVSLALAQQGFEVTGLDLSRDMLDVFESKLAAHPNLKTKIAIVHGDMANFTLPQKYALIIAPFHAFQVLTEEGSAEASLRCIHAHLAAEGVFILNVFKPYAVLDESWCFEEQSLWEQQDDVKNLHIVKKHRGDRIDVRRQIIHPQFAYEVTDASGRKNRYVEDVALAYYYELQLQQMLEISGFQILERYGWYDKQPIEDNSRELIFVCKKKLGKTDCRQSAL